MTINRDTSPITVPAHRVLAVGITPTRMAVWAMQKRREGRPDQALRLLDAAAALIRQEATDGAPDSAARPSHSNGGSNG